MHAASETTADLPHAPALSGMIWTGVLSHLDPRYGGLSTAVPELSRQISLQSGCTVQLAAFCSPDEAFSDGQTPGLAMSTWPVSRRRWLFDRPLQHTFAALIAKGAGVHIHGLWEQSTASAAHAAQRRSLPYIVSAHGMLEPWALRQKSLKKKLYAALIERNILERASCLHALTSTEAQDYRSFGCTAPIAVIPNGVTVPERVSPDPFLALHPELAGKRIVLFLSRLHKKKGLDLLVASWAEVSRQFPDAHLVLAGPDADGARSTIEASLASSGLGRSVLLPGMLRDDLKWSALAAAEGYVLPSFSEGLSMSVLEAMGLGLPVIISRHCNLPEVDAVGAGAVIPADVDSVRHALLELLGRSPESNSAIGRRGRDHVLRHFSWASVAAEMSKVYRWTSEGGAPPATVQLLEPQRSGGLRP